MTGTITKIIVGVVTLFSVAGALPVVPSEMQFKLAYQYPAGSDRTDYRLVTSTTTGESQLTNVGALPDADFTDNNGDGIISVAVFTDNKGNDVYIRIPDLLYKRMTEQGGFNFNPKKTDYNSLFDVLIPQAQAAIAVDATADGWVASATSLTYAHTISGSNTALTVGLFSFAGGDTCTGITWDGVALTQLGKRASDAGGYTYLYGGATANTGTHNIVVSYSTTVQIFADSVSYTGVSQSAPFPDAGTSGSQTGTSFSPTFTTSVDQSWVFLTTRTPSYLPSAGADTFVRKSNSVSADAAVMIDSNGARSTGSNALNYSIGGSKTIYWVIDALAPAAAGGTPEATTTPRIHVSGDVELGGDIIMQ